MEKGIPQPTNKTNTKAKWLARSDYPRLLEFTQGIFQTRQQQVNEKIAKAEQQKAEAQAELHELKLQFEARERVFREWKAAQEASFKSMTRDWQGTRNARTDWSLVSL